MSQFCGRAAGLDRGAGRAAAVSSAFHAQASGATDAKDMIARLTDEEQAELTDWSIPADIVLEHGAVLSYVDAEKELRMALDRFGRAVKPGDPSAETVGSLDMAWRDGGIAYIGDIKRSSRTSSVDSLQLIAYGFAYAALHGCHAFRCGIWALDDATWLPWGNVVVIDSPEGEHLWARVLASARNTGGDYATGPHCRDCWSRFRCPAYLLPPEVAETSLAPLAEGNVVLGAENAYQLLSLVERAETTIEAAKGTLKVYAERHGIRDGAGKVYTASMVSGRATLDQKALLAAIPEAGQYMKKGAPYSVIKWLKEPKGPNK